MKIDDHFLFCFGLLWIGYIFEVVSVFKYWLYVHCIASIEFSYLSFCVCFYCWSEHWDGGLKL
jgi:hypothetical protein